MNIEMNQKVKSFVLKNKREVSELNGTLYEFVHEVTKAELVYLETEDSNKLFSASFRTYPNDDTGVFHILEHSVLCGSEKYPVREPFVEIMKSSMNTFLNAMTFPDKTMYPIASRNEKDFHNLMSVYLDAVFKPSIYTNPNIFYQEGWHYELTNKDEDPIYKGVVFNEMKGAEASVDTLMMNELMRMLYPDTTYGYVSGGDSTKIPELTYENFLKAHQKFYHPSNCIFYLEGKMDLEAAVSMICEYVDTYEEGTKFALEMQEAMPAAERTCYYDIAKEEDEENRAHVVLGKIVSSYEDKNKNLAMTLLNVMLSSSNEAPLKKAIIENNLAQDIALMLETDIAQPFFIIQAMNTNANKKDEIKKTIKAVIEKMLEEGLDKAELEANLNQMAFQFREPAEPKALYHNIQALNAGLYGGDMLTYLTYDDAFVFLREMIQTDYYEKLLREMFSEENMQTLVMLPSKTIGDEMKAEEAKRLSDVKKTWSEKEIENLININEKLVKWQATPDTLEQLATIPTLELSDVEALPEQKITTERDYDGVKILLHPAPSDSVVYLNLYFKIPELAQKEYAYLRFMTSLMTNLPTHQPLPLLLQDIKRHLGMLSVEIATSAKVGQRDSCDTYFVVRCSVLKENVQEAIRLIKEVLYETDFTKEKEIKIILAQELEMFRNGIIEGGHQFAMLGSLSSYTHEGYVKEACGGYSSYLVSKSLNQNFEDEVKDFIAFTKKIKAGVLNKSSLMVSVTTANEEAENFAKMVIDGISEGETFAPYAFSCAHKVNRAITIPARISYAALGSNVFALNGDTTGQWKVLAKVASLAYLWNVIRVQGGAYGAGLSISPSGNIGFYTYRDPSAEKSIAVCRQTADFIRNFCDSEEGLDNYIISSIADTEPLLTPRRYGIACDNAYLRKTTYQDECAIRQAMLACTKEDLLKLADILDGIKEESDICVVGHQGTIEKLDEYHLKVENI